MQEANFDEAIEAIVSRDQRYHREAYCFVRQALEFTQKKVIKSREDKTDHVTGQELLAGIKEFALQQFGPMALSVLEEWGVRHCSDFGEIVFNMVEIRQLTKTDNDSRDDFKNAYDFDEAFRQP